MENSPLSAGKLDLITSLQSALSSADGMATLASHKQKAQQKLPKQAQHRKYNSKQQI
jgi:hypothetical protein